MKLVKLVLQNFRQFEGCNEIDFTVSKEKNVIVIVGVTGAGKTTLIDSFGWCLYGFLGENVDKGVDISPLSEGIQEKMRDGEETKCIVELHIEINNEIYIIKREQTFQKNGEIKPRQINVEVSTVGKDGLTRPSKKKINEFLPKAISKYFFFKGENLENLGEDNKVAKEEIKQAITTILGMDVIDEAINHLRGMKGNPGVVNSFERDFESDTNTDVAATQESLTEKRDLVASLEVELGDVNNSISDCEKEIIRLNNILIKNEKTKELQTEIGLLIKKKEEDQNDLSVFYQSFVMNWSRESRAVLISNIVKSALPIVKSNPTIGEGVPRVHADSIDFIIKRKKCICGTDSSKTPGFNRPFRTRETIASPTKHWK